MLTCGCSYGVGLRGCPADGQLTYQVGTPLLFIHYNFQVMKNLNYFRPKGSLAYLFTLLLSLLTSLNLKAQPYVWEEVGQLPFKHFLMSAEKVDTLIYLMGGIYLAPGGAASTNGVYAYNPANHSIQGRKSLPQPLAGMASAVYNGNIYVFGGMPWSQGPPRQKSYKYVPGLDQWFELPDLPTMPRSYAIAELLNDKIYVIGGMAENSTTTYNLVEVFDPELEVWVTDSVAPMPTPRGYMGSAVLNDRIYVFGGGTPAPDYYGLPTVEYFDGENWFKADTMPTHRYGAGAGVLGDSLIIVSGGVLSGWNDVNVTEGYSEETGWHTLASLPNNMHGHSVVSFGDVLYAFGGVAGPVIYDKVLVFRSIANSTNNPFTVNDLSVFPNPAGDQLTVINRSGDDGCLMLIQADGRVVAHLRLQAQSQQSLNIVEVMPGLLMWKWMPDCERVLQTGKVMVVK